MNNVIFIVLTGTGATILMDLWGVLRAPLLGSPPPNYGMLGRWIAHMAHGQFRHQSIAKADAMKGEKVLGWAAHYLIGMGFAAMLVGIWGEHWINNPTIGPALIVGIGTIAAPFLLMQPGMGAGIAASRTKNPGAARLQSLVTHTIFGFGLYLSGLTLNFSLSL